MKAVSVGRMRRKREPFWPPCAAGLRRFTSAVQCPGSAKGFVKLTAATKRPYRGPCRLLAGHARGGQHSRIPVISTQFGHVLGRPIGCRFGSARASSIPKNDNKRDET